MPSKKADLRSADQMSAVDIPMPAEAGTGSEDRSNRIAIAAFLRAASRDFIGGDPVEDWLQAEIEVDASLKAR
jgi:Protein of unknown function (DUF2934)